MEHTATPSQSSGGIGEVGAKRYPEAVDDYKEAVSSGHSRVNTQFGVVVTVCTRPKARPNISMDRGIVHIIPALNKLLVPTDCQERKRPFSLKVYPLIN